MILIVGLFLDKMFSFLRITKLSKEILKYFYNILILKFISVSCSSKCFSSWCYKYFCLEKSVLGQVFSVVGTFQCLLIVRVYKLCILGMYTLDFFFSCCCSDTSCVIVFICQREFFLWICRDYNKKLMMCTFFCNCCCVTLQNYWRLGNILLPFLSFWCIIGSAYCSYVMWVTSHVERVTECFLVDWCPCM